MSTKWSKRELKDIRLAAWIVAYHSVPGGEENESVRAELRKCAHGKEMVLAGIADNIAMYEARIRQERSFEVWIGSPDGRRVYPDGRVRLTLGDRAYGSRRESERRLIGKRRLLERVRTATREEILEILRED